VQVGFQARETGTGGFYRDWASLGWARLRWFGALGLGALGVLLGTSVCRSVFKPGRPEPAGFIEIGLRWAGLGCAGLVRWVWVLWGVLWGPPCAGPLSRAGARNWRVIQRLGLAAAMSARVANF
jgi:hypothetical protein